MESFVLWLGFVGAWLVFAGSIYQAALELLDVDIEVERIRATGAKIERAKKSSGWWWLIPPIKFYLESKNHRDYQRRYTKALKPEDIEAMLSFRNKSTAWLFVALGGICIAFKETYELAHHNEWPDSVMAILVLMMFILSIVNLVSRLKRAKAILSE